MAEIETKVRQSGQFSKVDTEKSAVLEGMLSVWGRSVCPSNAMLGGYLANFVMFYVQRKRKPLRNWLWFDMWSCDATEMLMRSVEDEAADRKMEEERKQKAMETLKEAMEVRIKAKAGKGTMGVDAPDIAKLTVRRDDVVCLDDDSDDADEDIDLID